MVFSDLLLSLGYSEAEIWVFEHHWAEGILAFLSANQANVAENMRSLQKEFEPELLLKLPVFYPDAFVLPPQDFYAHMQALQAAFPMEWQDIIENQFWGFDGYDGKYMNDSTVSNPILYQPFLETVGTNNEAKISEALYSLLNPTSRIYKFVVMLNTIVGTHLSTQDFPENCLLLLEICKDEMIDSIRFLQKKNIPDSVLLDIFTVNPMILCGSECELENSLTAAFGDDYAETMIKTPSELLEDALCNM